MARQEPADGENGGCGSALDTGQTHKVVGIFLMATITPVVDHSFARGLARPHSIQEKARGVGRCGGYADRVLHAAVSAGDPRQRQSLSSPWTMNVFLRPWTMNVFLIPWTMNVFLRNDKYGQEMKISCKCTTTAIASLHAKYVKGR